MLIITSVKLLVLGFTCITLAGGAVGTAIVFGSYCLAVSKNPDEAESLCPAAISVPVGDFAKKPVTGTSGRIQPDRTPPGDEKVLPRTILLRCLVNRSRRGAMHQSANARFRPVPDTRCSPPAWRSRTSAAA